MRPFEYHEGQRMVQREANSIKCADSLSKWVGPVSDFALIADLVVLASIDNDAFRTAAISGRAPLVGASENNGDIALELPTSLVSLLGSEHSWGGIVINLAQARRSRISGMPIVGDDSVTMQCDTAFTNCRKYMVPSHDAGTARHVGPESVETLEFDDPWVESTIAHGETAFLITASPAGVADASHRGGYPGFLRYDDVTHTIAWTDYLGDGMFVSMGNVRSSGHAALIVLELSTGDALRLELDATYTNIRSDRHERVDALLQANEPHPVQGRVVALITRAERLKKFCNPRARVEKQSAFNSENTRVEQHPQ